MPQLTTLPTEVLFNIFLQFLKNFNYTPYNLSAEGFDICTSDILQVQLTCKSWRATSRALVYQSAVLQSITELDMFMSTLVNNDIGALVENIYIDIGMNSADFLFSQVIDIARHCSNLKCLYTKIDIATGIWKVLERERAQGLFTKLQVMPLLDRHSNSIQSIEKYNTAAFQLRQSLREVMIYDMYVGLLAENRLSVFPNVETVRFGFTKYIGMYTIDQQMKNHLIREVEIYYPGNIIPDDRNYIADVFVSSRTKRLCVKSTQYTQRFYRYIMQVFPDFQDIVLTHTGYRNDNDSLIPLVEESAELFDYLMKRRCVEAQFYFSGTRNDFMVQIYDKNNKVRHLCLKYKSGEPNSFSGWTWMSLPTKSNLKSKCTLSKMFH